MGWPMAERISYMYACKGAWRQFRLQRNTIGQRPAWTPRTHGRRVCTCT